MARGARTRNSAAVIIVHYDGSAGRDRVAVLPPWLVSVVLGATAGWVARHAGGVPSPKAVLSIGGGDN